MMQPRPDGGGDGPGSSHWPGRWWRIFFLAPFSWLVLTSFMHEGDAMSVPLRLLPARPTLDNYATFVAPSGTRSIVGSRAAENTMPGIWNSLVAATGTAVLNLALGILAGYSFARLRFPAGRACSSSISARGWCPGSP